LPGEGENTGPSSPGESCTTLRLQRAWNKYGPDAVVFEIVELVEVERLIEREQYHIDLRDATNKKKGFNIRPKAESNLSMKLTEEQIAKRRGKTHSPETRPRMSETAKERHRETPHSEETRARIGAAHRGKTISEEHRASISAYGRTRSWSEEQRAKRLSYRHSPEVRARISEAAKRRWQRYRDSKIAQTQGQSDDQLQWFWAEDSPGLV
jgi:group I intron endonuclease